MTLRDSLRAEKALAIRRALAGAFGNRTHAANLLGITRQHLVRLIRELVPDLQRRGNGHE